MTKVPAQRARDRAQDLADRLHGEGRHVDAQIVSTLIRSSLTSSANNATLWEDNRRLREQLARP